MVSEQIPPRAAMHLLFAACMGNEPETSYIEVRWRRAEGGGMGQLWHSARRTEAIIDTVLAIGQKTDVYFGVNPRAQRRGGAGAIRRSWALHVDLDSPESIARLAELDPLPSIVVRSGSGGAHAYWPLRESIPGTWVKPATRRVAHHLGGDLAAAEPARILRPPATLNFKTTPPQPVVCTRLEPRVFTVRQVVGDLRDPEPRTPPARRVARPSDDDAAVAGLATAVRNAQPGNRNCTLYWAARRARDDGLDAREQLRCAALDAGLAENEIDATLTSALDRSEAA